VVKRDLGFPEGRALCYRGICYSPTSGGCSVGIVCLQTKAMEFVYFVLRAGRELWNYGIVSGWW
jgi:hypothetical protein